MNDETKETKQAPHHPRGMSKWSAILECPCFESAGESADSTVGTKCHALFADALRGYKESRKIPTEEEISALPMHEAGALRGARQVIEHYWGNAPRIETPIGILDTDIYGTPDYFALTERGCVVVDFKTFYNPGRDYFPQLEGYALGVLKVAYPFEKWDSLQAELVVIYGDKPDATEHCRVKFSDLKARFESAMRAFDVKEAGIGKPHQCNWCELCANRATCPEVTAVVKTVAEGELLHAPERWADLPVQRRAQMLVLAEAVSKWADTVRGLAKEDAMNGVAIQDVENGIAFKLRESRGRLTPRIDELWRNCQRLGISADDFREALSCSSTNAVKLIQTKGQGVKTKRQAEEIVRACSDVGKGSVSLVRA